MNKAYIVFKWDKKYQGSLSLSGSSKVFDMFEVDIPILRGCTFTKKAVLSNDSKMLYIAGTEKSAQTGGADVNCVFLYEFSGTEALPEWEYSRTFWAPNEEHTREVHYGFWLDCTADGEVLAIGCPCDDYLPGWIEIQLLDNAGNWRRFRISGVPGDRKFGTSFSIVGDVLYVDPHVENGKIKTTYLLKTLK